MTRDRSFTEASSTTSVSPHEKRGTVRAMRDRGFYAMATLTMVACATATLYFCRSMSGGMEMPGKWTMSMMWMRMPGQTWTTFFVMFLTMWQSMMVAMMLPPTLPMIVNYRREQYQRDATRPDVATLMFAGGYFFVWLVIGTLVYAAGATFALLTMRSAGLSRAVPVLSSATLIMAGVMQFTSWKMRALLKCRAPQACAITQAFSCRRIAWRQGLGQGMACAICCSGPMLILLALGAMNLVFMLMVTAMIAMEKLLPKPKLFVRTAGIIAAGAGTFMMVRLLS